MANYLCNMKELVLKKSKMNGGQNGIEFRRKNKRALKHKGGLV